MNEKILMDEIDKFEDDGDCFDEEMYDAHSQAWQNGYDSYPGGHPPYDIPSLNESWEHGWFYKQDKGI